MDLIVQPEHGLEPVLSAVDRARKTIDIMIFRLDIKHLVNGLENAVTRGVAVRALIAHTNKGGEKSLRRLETRLLAAGVTVSRTADDLVRYHGKMMIVDGRSLHVNGFNFTWLDVERSRSFGVATRTPRLVKEAQKLFQADCDRQPYVAACDRLVISPENARLCLTRFIERAKKQLLIYDPNVSDPRILKLLAARKSAGVDVRIIGHAGARAPVDAQKYPGKRLHVRAIIRDGQRAFIGSQSLRSLELDRRREIGIMVHELPVVKRLADVFEADWALTPAGKAAIEAASEATEDAGADDRRSRAGADEAAAS